MNPGLTISIRLLIVLAVCRQAAYAQDLHNGSSLYVNGVSIFIDGEVNNNGQLANAGSISFSGDWKNKGYYYGDGLIEAMGRAPQLISQGDQPIHTLVIDGGGTKYLEGALNIKSELRLVHGIVEVSRMDMLLLEGSASSSGGSPESYVDGALTVEGTGYKFFPIGKNGTYAPIELLDVDKGAGRYAIEVFENAPTVSVENVVVKRSLYWRRADVAGHFSSSRVAIDYERSFFDHRDGIVLLAGDSFDEPLRVIHEVQQSAETDKIFTVIPVSSKILMLGELSTEWTDADFYLSTALSPMRRSLKTRVSKYSEIA